MKKETNDVLHRAKHALRVMKENWIPVGNLEIAAKRAVEYELEKIIESAEKAKVEMEEKGKET